MTPNTTPSLPRIQQVRKKERLHTSRMSRHVLRKRRRVARLNKHRPRTRKLAHQPFPGAEITDDPARRDALEDILAVPGYEVSVIDDIFLPFP